MSPIRHTEQLVRCRCISMAADHFAFTLQAIRLDDCNVSQ